MFVKRNKNLLGKRLFITTQKLLAVQAQQVFASGFLLPFFGREVAKISSRGSILQLLDDKPRIQVTEL